MNEFLKRFFELVKRKVDHCSKQAKSASPWNAADWLEYDIYLEWIKNETDEVIPEIKMNNSVYLEDELWDIFWRYINLLYILEQGWYISKEKVFERCEEKFWKRIEALEKNIPWNEIKKIQKEKLAKQHEEKYGK